MKKHYRIVDACHVPVLAFCVSAFFLIYNNLLWIIPVGFLFLASNIFPGFLRSDVKNDRLLFSYHGCVVLCVTAATFPIVAIYYTTVLYAMLPENYLPVIFAAIYVVALYTVLIANGIVSIYVTSGQLGVKWRAMGVLFALIPVLNLFVLGKMVSRVLREVDFETMRHARNKARSDEKVCATKYPLVFVHGIFMRDWAIFNYWGRIPEELETNGARIYYGEHQSALPVAESAKELAARIKRIVAKTDCGKVNIIAHSKGGLDCRYAIEHYGIGDLVASLTTVNSPHRGCLFAEKLLKIAPRWFKHRVAESYNKSMRFLGDKTPDFMAGVRDLTPTPCQRRDRELGIPEGIYCQSIGSIQNRALAGRFPMNLSEPYVKRYDGENDGLVGRNSFSFGERYRLLETNGRRGITHMDMIDMNREDIKGFDVREFYVEVVRDLKSRGF
ncbi:MAG: triacylglycerol lipase [Clostridia bacterium]|nr:triacylglycerol lipase [Clostridia bacterium]